MCCREANCPTVDQRAKNTLGTDQPIVGIGPLQNFIEEKEQGPSIAGAVDDGFQPADGGVEQRFAALERIANPHGGAELKNRRRERARTHGSACLSQHEIGADGAQHRALAGHVRPADQDEPHLVIEPKVIANAVCGWNERMTDFARLEARPRIGDLRKRILRMVEGKRGDAGQGLELANCFEPVRNVRSNLRPPAFDRMNQMDREPQHEGDRDEELIPQAVVEPFDQRFEPADVSRGGRPWVSSRRRISASMAERKFSRSMIASTWARMARPDAASPARRAILRIVRP